jgi:small ligand-binding sensory domain FIST
MLPVATAIATATKPAPELAAEAVRAALARAGQRIAESVLLLLTGEFSRNTHAALLAASRAANCLQITGCTASGIFTESDWVLDRAAACAMVFCGGPTLAPAGGETLALLSFAAPNAATDAWLRRAAGRVGMISTDGSSQSPGRIWCHGKLAEDGRCEAGLTGVRAAISVSRGLRVLSEPQVVTAVSGYDVIKLAGYPALNLLLRELPLEVREQPRLPTHLLCAGILPAGMDDSEMERCEVAPVIAINSDDRSVTLAAPVEPGTRLFWAMRQALAAERDTRVALEQAGTALGVAPEFAIAFSCMGRGPYFFGGADRDLEIFVERFPGVPLVGAYGAGEIVPSAEGARVVHNSAVFALFARQ